MGKASRTKRDRRDRPTAEMDRKLPVLPSDLPDGLGAWDGPTGYATGAGVTLLRERGVADALLDAYAATGILPTVDAVDGATAEELLMWGAALHHWETSNWDVFIATRSDLADKLTTNPAGDSDATIAALVDAAWALVVGWPSSAAVTLVDSVDRDDEQLSALMGAAALAIASLKNDGVFTNAVTRACITFGREFNVDEKVRSYLGVANFEPAVIRMHEENSAAVMLTVHAAILAGAISAGGVTIEQIIAAATAQD